MKIKYFIILTFLLIFFNEKLISINNDDTKKYEKEKRYDGLTDSKDAYNHYIRGMQLYYDEQYYKGYLEFEKALLKDEEFELALIMLGKCAFLDKNYEKAESIFLKYLDVFREDVLKKNEVNNMLARSRYLMEFEKASEIFSGFLPENLGQNINSDKDDVLPKLELDRKGLYFIRMSTPENVKNVEITKTELFYSQRKNDDSRWGEAKSSDLNKYKLNIGPFDVYKSITGVSSIYFTYCLYKNEALDCNLYNSINKNGMWYPPMSMGSHFNSILYDGQPSLTNDGKNFYFTSQRNGGKGSFDIWVNDKNEWGKWGIPKNVEDPINSNGLEQFPYIYSDGQTLFFSTKIGINTFGGFDIFKTSKSEFSLDLFKWTNPENIRKPINSIKNDFNIFISDISETVYLSTDVYEGFGGIDLFEWKMENKYAIVNNENVSLNTIFPIEYKKTYPYEDPYYGDFLNFSNGMDNNTLLKLLNITWLKLKKSITQYNKLELLINNNKIDTTIPFVKFNEIFFTIDGQFFVIGGNFYHVENATLRIGNGIVAIENGKIIIRGNKFLNSSMVEMKEGDFLRTNILNFEYKNDLIYFKEFVINKNGDVYNYKKNYKINKQGDIFVLKGKDSEEIFINNFKTRPHPIYNNPINTMTNQLNNEKTKTLNEYASILSNNNFSWVNDTLLSNDSMIIFKGPYVFLNKGQVFIKDGLFFNKDTTEINEKAVPKSDWFEFKNDNIVLKNGAKITRYGEVVFEDKSVIHVSGNVINSEGFFIEYIKNF